MAQLMDQSVEARRALRQALSAGLQAGSASRAVFEAALHCQDQVTLGLPCDVGDYTDFYTSIHHATTIGRQMRPDNPLLPNYKWVPIGYHGRASSIVPSGTAFHRPKGQTKAPDAATPSFGPCQRLDYELELGVVMARGNALGEPVAMADAEDHVFGISLFNDWSARDIQGWEYQPLGPFSARPSHGPKVTRRRWTTCTHPPTTPRAVWTLRWRSGCKPPPCKPLATPVTVCPHPITRTPTGVWPNWWRTTPSTGATCALATCWAPARCQAPVQGRAAR
jgi:fumarylacetoacetase